MPNPATCFVIMGFGKKTDYGEKVRTLDIDAPYNAIIKPAVEDCGLKCIRAAEVTHSGVIDVKMYELLLRSDLVIADISTANANRGVHKFARLPSGDTLTVAQMRVRRIAPAAECRQPEAAC